MESKRSGPLAGVKVIELGGIGPVPFAGMMLSDLGAEIVRVDRLDHQLPGVDLPLDKDVHHRGKKSVLLDLRRPEARAAVLELIENFDVLIEGFRPGVTERLGVGPDECFRRNPALVYGRMTGWGQSGPMSAMAGHDINYIAVSGALHGIGEAGGRPQIPMNLVGDYGGGATYLVVGVLAALREAASTGTGQVVDAAIVDGVTHLLAGNHSLFNVGVIADERGVNITDGGAPFYNVYVTSDGGYIAVGAIEPKFYEALVRTLDVDLAPAKQFDKSTWAAAHQKIGSAFVKRTRDHWIRAFENVDACVVPVESLRESVENEHLCARGSVVRTGGSIQPGRAPRFSRYPDGDLPSSPRPGQHTRETLETYTSSDVAALLQQGAASECLQVPGGAPAGFESGGRADGGCDDSVGEAVTPFTD